MQIEKLNEDKIRITLNLEDLKENNIDLHSFMANSIESQDLFYTMLDKAEKEVGFETKDYKLMIEALAIPNGNFVLTVTRLTPEKEHIKKPKIKRNAINLVNNIAIYEFDNFDNFIELCKNIHNTTYPKMKKTSLYKLNSKYYLVLNIKGLNLDSFKFLHCYIIEFGKFITHSDLFERKLLEYGAIIFKTNAIEKCVYTFLN